MSNTLKSEVFTYLVKEHHLERDTERERDVWVSVCKTTKTKRRRGIINT